MSDLLSTYMMLISSSGFGFFHIFSPCRFAQPGKGRLITESGKLRRKAVQLPHTAGAVGHNASSKARQTAARSPHPALSHSINTPLIWTDCQETVHGQSEWRSGRARMWLSPSISMESTHPPGRGQDSHSPVASLSRFSALHGRALSNSEPPQWFIPPSCPAPI